jgi:hypothetical protein
VEVADDRPRRVRIEIPFATIARILVAALLVVVVLKLWLLFLIFLVAVHRLAGRRRRDLSALRLPAQPAAAPPDSSPSVGFQPGLRAASLGGLRTSDRARFLPTSRQAMQKP